VPEWGHLLRRFSRVCTRGSDGLLALSAPKLLHQLVEFLLNDLRVAQKGDVAFGQYVNEDADRYTSHARSLTQIDFVALVGAHRLHHPNAIAQLRRRRASPGA
jgi:hypothetical protein